jgi:cellobiose epimerase
VSGLVGIWRPASGRNRPEAENDIERTSIGQELESVLQHHVIDAWFPRSLDVEYGGFLCDFDRVWRQSGPHHKLLEFQARHTWLAAEASRAYPADERLRRVVALGFRYLRDAMWDSVMGGWFHRLDRGGRPLEERTKHVHGAAYAIGACVAVHEATQEPGALALARQGFEWLEHTAHDDRHGGYFGFLRQDGSVIRAEAECPWPAATDTIDTPIGLKDTNVHSDLLETFAHLYRVWPNPAVAQRLAELVAILEEKIIIASGGLHFFFQPDWTPLPYRARFGYQVQTAHRLLLAGGVGGNAERLATTARQLVSHALRHAWDPHAGGLFDAGPESAPARIEDEALGGRRKSWWPQVEALKALLSLAELEASDPSYRRYVTTLWRYMRRYMIDFRHGGVYTVGLEGRPPWQRGLGVGLAPASFTRKGNAWKDSSHEGRAWLHCISILRRRR